MLVKYCFHLHFYNSIHIEMLLEINNCLSHKLGLWSEPIPCHSQRFSIMNFLMSNKWDFQLKVFSHCCFPRGFLHCDLMMANKVRSPHKGLTTFIAFIRLFPVINILTVIKSRFSSEIFFHIGYTNRVSDDYEFSDVQWGMNSDQKIYTFIVLIWGISPLWFFWCWITCQLQINVIVLIMLSPAMSFLMPDKRWPLTEGFPTLDTFIRILPYKCFEVK